MNDPNTRRFTLIELMVALVVFSLLMVLLLQFLLATERAWSLNQASQEIIENQRIALELIERDLNSAVTSSLPGQEIGFYIPDPDDDGFSCYFVSSSSMNESANYRLCEISYRVKDRRLQRQLITSREADWDFFADDTVVDPPWVESSIDTYETLLDDGVTELQIHFYETGNDTQPMAAGTTFQLPSRAEVTLVLHDASLGMISEEKRLTSQQSFTRVIYLNKFKTEEPK